MVIVTVLELLKQKLPPDYVLAIIENMEEKIMLDEESKGSLLEELEDLFPWSTSNEGYQFWADVFDSIGEGNPLPKLPFRARWRPNTYLCMENGSFLVNADGSGKDYSMEIDTSKLTGFTGRYFKEQHLAFLN